MPPEPRRVVVIDDDVDVAETTAAALRALGPHIDGFRLAAALKSVEPGLCVVAVTAYGEPEHRRLGRSAGFDAYLVKPVDLPTLAAALDTLFKPRPPR